MIRGNRRYIGDCNPVSVIATIHDYFVDLYHQSLRLDSNPLTTLVPHSASEEVWRLWLVSPASRDSNEGWRIFHNPGLLMFCCRDKMAVVAHLVGIDQLGYEKELGMTPSVSFPVWKISTTTTDLYDNVSGDEEWQVVARDAAEGQRGWLGRGRGRLEGHEEGAARHSR